MTWIPSDPGTANHSAAGLLFLLRADVPLAVPSLHLPDIQAPMVLGLAVGLFFTIPLFTIILSRLIFESALPDAQQPTLMILLAVATLFIARLSVRSVLGVVQGELRALSA